MAFPSPRLAPVISATFPSKVSFIVSAIVKCLERRIWYGEIFSRHISVFVGRHAAGRFYVSGHHPDDGRLGAGHAEDGGPVRAPGTGTGGLEPHAERRSDADRDQGPRREQRPRGTR